MQAYGSYATRGREDGVRKKEGIMKGSTASHAVGPRAQDVRNMERRIAENTVNRMNGVNYALNGHPSAKREAVGEDPKERTLAHRRP